VSSIILLLGIPAAHAAFIQNTFGLSDPHSTITFDEHVLPYLTGVTTEYSDLGVTFSPYGLYFDSANTGGNFGKGIGNFVPSGYGGDRFPIGINFTKPQTEAAFRFISADATTTFQAFLGGNLVESFDVVTGDPANPAFYGFRDITFDAISITTPGCGFAVCPEIVDNIQLPTASSSVPEPSSILGILSFGILGTGAILKRKIKPSKPSEKDLEIVS
jgi:hypothetical protein